MQWPRASHLSLRRCIETNLNLQPCFGLQAPCLGNPFAPAIQSSLTVCSAPRDMHPTPASASLHVGGHDPLPTTDRPLPPHLATDPEALECPVAGCRYDAHLHAPVRTPLCLCNRLVCRQCALAAASRSTVGPCGACGRSGDVRVEAEGPRAGGVGVEVDGGVLAVLGARTLSTVSRWVVCDRVPSAAVFLRPNTMSLPQARLYHQ